MKPGSRAVGIAESYGQPGPGGSTDGDGNAERQESTVAAAVVRADRTLDGLAFGTWTVGGADATDAVVTIVESLEREDVQYLLLAGVAPAWFNLVDVAAVHARTEVPTVAVSFEASAGLETAIDRAFDGEARESRLRIYRRLPSRERLTVNGEALFVRVAGIDPDAARDVVRAFTPEGGRPVPLRVARLAARAADRWRGGP